MSGDAPNNLLLLLQSIESISSCLDRNRLPFALADAVAGVFGASSKVGIFMRSGDPRQGGSLRFCSEKSHGFPCKPLVELASDIARGTGVKVVSANDWHYGAVALEPSELYGEEPILVFRANRPVDATEIRVVDSLARIFGNQILMIDYSELDSLTRLLNRKSFDETFDQLLSAPSESANDIWRHERRSSGAESPAWLGIIDIDHFKRINDSFGHVFGDEVLLRVSNLLRKTFRDTDRLFRFGGEEFVVILNAPDRALAETCFERFRVAVEEHEFPQVGTVTCSIGFTAIMKTDVPIDAVGRADQSMYFAKNCGRNRVCCYERLVAQGAVADAVRLSTGAEDIDVDALFAEGQ